MSFIRSYLHACTIASVTILLFPVFLDSTAESADRSVQNLPIQQVRITQIKAPRSHKRKPAVRLTPPEGILLKDLTTGQTLFEQNAHQPMPPASLTKIMSAIVILEEGNLEDSVTVSRHAAAAHPIKLYLKPGQVVPLRGLLEAMLVRSTNDACMAAVEHVGGDEATFVTKMNAKGEAIGLTHTQFRNACGFDMDAHYSTAEDLATLTEYAMTNETFAAIVKEPAAVIRTVNQRKTFVARTTNRLLGTMEGIMGVKTGYTKGAGRCLIAIVHREGKELLLVLLNARQRWSTAHTMIEYGLRPQSAILATVSR